MEIVWAGRVVFLSRRLVIQKARGQIYLNELRRPAVKGHVGASVEICGDRVG